MNCAEHTYCQAVLNATHSGTFAGFDFTGKEKDSESSFRYFGARYYDSEALTGWLSVDPMSDKYPSISPYAYCAWNPVKLVDPDGRDWYDIDKNGHVTKNTEKQNESNEHDVLYSTSTSKQISLPLGTITNVDDESFSNGQEGVQVSLSSKVSIKDRMDAFKFVSDNTNVEWSMSSFLGNNSNWYFELTTSYSDGSDNVMGRRNDDFGGMVVESYIDAGYTFVARIHNHHGTYPNTYDKRYAKVYSNSTQYVYDQVNNRYYQVSSSGIKQIIESNIQGL